MFLKLLRPHSQRWGRQMKSLTRRLTGVPNQRYLGALEQNMYHGRKLIPNLLTLECDKKVEECDILKALELMTIRHPMLRMSIQENEKGPFFIENLDKKIDIHIYEDADIYEVAKDQYIRHFEKGSEVWRFNLLKNRAFGNGSPFQFVFSMHHCAFDFPYSYLVVLEFLESLRDVQNGLTSDRIYVHYSFQPSCEQIKSLQYESHTSKGDVLNKPRHSLTPALQAYEYYFRDEIKNQSSTQKLLATCEQINVGAATSTKFISLCKKQKIPSTGAILALLTLSFSQLLRSKGCEESIMYDFVVWTNLRRYMDKDSEFYTGMAVVPTQISVVVDSLSCLDGVFWSVASDINCQIRTAIDNKTPLKVLHEIYPKWLKEGRKKGKLDSVFSLSHVETLDIFNPELRKHFTLKDYQAIADLDVDYSPIFLVLSSIQHGSLQIGTAYTSSYTSKDTAICFTSYIRKTIEAVLR